MPTGTKAKAPRRAAPPVAARLVLWAAVFAVGALSTWAVLRPSPRPDPTQLIGQTIAFSQTLLSTKGQTFSPAALKGQPSLVMFGFTHCPDICPMSLGLIQDLRAALEARGQPLGLWLITLDPERDTLDVLSDYLEWAPEITGLRPSPEDLKQILANFGIWARTVPLPQGGYTIDHSAAILVLSAQGALVGHLNPLADPEALERELVGLLGL